MKLIEIAQGWYNFITADEKNKEMAEKRLQICDGCPEKRQIGATGQAILSVLNDKASIYKCGKCGCPLSAKTLSPDSLCPDGKW